MIIPNIVGPSIIPASSSPTKDGCFKRGMVGEPASLNFGVGALDPGEIFSPQFSKLVDGFCF